MRTVGALLLGAFLMRGVFLLAVLPPLEGWDEYQHLAYLTFLDEQGRRPTPRDTVPGSLIAAMRAYPSPRGAVAQLAGQGIVGYETFWAGGASSPEPFASAPPIYEAQHPSLYYRLMLPLFRAAGGVRRLLPTVTALRLANLALGAAGLGLAVAIVAARSDPRRPGLAALGLAVQPLIVLNAARVANDALALVAGLAAVWLILRPRLPMPANAALAGILIAVAAATKQNMLVLLLWAPAVMLLRRSPREAPPGRRALEAALVVLPTLAVLLAGSSDEAPVLAMQELGRGRLFATAIGFGWLLPLAQRLAASLWVGGWSFFVLPMWMYVAQGVLVGTALAGLARIAWVRRRHMEVAWESLALVLLVTVTGAGLAFHAMASLAAWGKVQTNPWYGLIALPALFVLIDRGASALPGRLSRDLLFSSLAALYLAGEAIGVVLVMVPQYTGGAHGALAVQRIAALHPAWLSPYLGAAAELAALVMVGLGWLLVRRRTAEAGRPDLVPRLQHPGTVHPG